MHPTNPTPDSRFTELIDRFKLCLILAAICLGMSVLQIGCPIKFSTGISCPGCGMTRAVLAALHLNFKAAFYYHPLFVLLPGMLGLYLFESYLSPVFCKTAWIIVIVIFFITYFYRLLIAPNGLVAIDINDGIVLKLIHQIFSGGL